MQTVIKNVKRLIINSETRKWCKLPYPQHPYGCPNYGRPKCPPRYPLFNKILDLEKPIYIVAIRFDLENHAERIKTLHPEWNDRQCRNLRYWQGTVNKKLKEEVNKILAEGKLGDKAEFGPEAAGVNAHLTCYYSGIKLKWPPGKYVYKLALIGFARQKPAREI